MKNTMTRLTAIVLCIVMVLGCSVCAFAAESKTEKFIKDLQDKKEVTIKIDDSFFAEELDEIAQFVNISNAKIEAKLGKDVQLAASLRVFGVISVRALYKNNSLYVYIPLLRIKANVSKILDAVEPGETVDELINMVTGEFDTLLKYFSYMTVTETGKKNIPGYGEVYCETLSTDLKTAVKLCLEDGRISIPAGVNWEAMSDDELNAYLKTLDAEPAADEFSEPYYPSYEAVQDTLGDICFIFDGNDLVDILEYEDGEYYGLLGDFPIESISVGVNELDFLTPILYFELSGLATTILNMVEEM